MPIRVVDLRTPWNYDVDAVSEATGLLCLDESLADQSQIEECDINTIVRRFGLTGQLPASPRMPSFGDFEGVNDYQSALNMLMEADDAFMEFPAEIRKRFDNDPQQFMAFVHDEANYKEALELGLVLPRAAELASAAPSAADASSAAASAASGVTASS